MEPSLRAAPTNGSLRFSARSPSTRKINLPPVDQNDRSSVGANLINSLATDLVKGNESINNIHNGSVMENVKYEQKKFMNIKQTSAYTSGANSVIP
jgi:hypothetical protein